jgi:hypothetical protein
MCGCDKITSLIDRSLPLLLSSHQSINPTPPAALVGQRVSGRDRVDFLFIFISPTDQLEFHEKKLPGIHQQGRLLDTVPRIWWGD